MKRIGKFVAWAGASIMMAGIFGFIAVALLFHHYSKDLPSFEKLAEYSPPVVTRLYAGDGSLLAEYAREKRIFVPYKAIPRRVVEAFIAAEDKNFYSHQGIDIFGIARAVIENITNYGSGRSMVGGSTITQQVVKNFLLSNEKTLERKIKEAILAYRISHIYTKEKILELYLNEIYLGYGSYGVAAAALNYFNKPLNELSTEEAALLAAMPKAPSRYNPLTNYEAAQKRRNYVIGRMLDDGYIDALEASRASTAPIALEERASDEITRADFFAEEARRTLADMYGSGVLYEGGLTVKTTVDPPAQQMADAALRQALIDYDRRYGYRGPLMQLEAADNWEERLLDAAADIDDVPLYGKQQFAAVLETTPRDATIGLPSGAKGTIALKELKWAREDLKGQRRGKPVNKVSDVLSPGDIIIVTPLDGEAKQYALHQVPEVNGALVVMDPHTGRVLAMSGGYSYEGSEFNRATQARRQPGSAFKPFVYLTALESGFTPSTIILDEPIEIEQGPGLPIWKPQNYGGDFLGPTTLRVGLEKSRNTMTVRLAKILGINRVVDVAQRLGIYDSGVPRNYSMVLGAYETTLLDMVTAYAMIANGGREVKASLIERIDDREGNIVFRRDTRECIGCDVNPSSAVAINNPPIIEDDRNVVIDPRVAYQMTSILEGVVKRGTAVRARKIGKPLAGKTGTTNDSRDVWFIGFSPDLVAGVYIGYDQPKTLGRKQTGSRVALPAFIDFMQSALADEPATPFRTPPGIMMVEVDRATGLPPQPGMPGAGKTITEAFAVGGPIYRPASTLAEAKTGSEADSQAAIMENYDKVQEGFDPYAGWEDTDYYMSPQKAQWQDYRRRQQAQERQGAPSGRPAEARIGPSNNPAGFDPTQMPMMPRTPIAQQPNSQYQPGPPLRSEPGYNPNTSASQGTGGLY